MSAELEQFASQSLRRELGELCAARGLTFVDPYLQWRDAAGRVAKAADDGTGHMRKDLAPFVWQAVLDVMRTEANVAGDMARGLDSGSIAMLKKFPLCSVIRLRADQLTAAPPPGSVLAITVSGCSRRTIRHMFKKLWRLTSDAGGLFGVAIARSGSKEVDVFMDIHRQRVSACCVDADMEVAVAAAARCIGCELVRRLSSR